MTTLSGSPLLSTIERAVSTFQYLAIPTSTTVPDGWHRSSDVIDNPALLNQMIDGVYEIYGMENRQVAASFLVMGYFWYMSLAPLSCFLLDRRLPNMLPEHVAIHQQHGVCLLSTGCAVLPDDPLAGHPDTTVVPDIDAMRARLMSQLDEHTGPFFATLRSIAPYGIPAMRANYLDRIASAIIWLADQLGDPEISRREVPAFMAHGGPKVRTGIIDLHHEGKQGVYIKRAGCCLNYRLDGREKCDTCSLIPMDERITGLKATYLS